MSDEGRVNHLKSLITQLTTHSVKLGELRQKKIAWESVSAHVLRADVERQIDDEEVAVRHFTRKLHEALGLVKDVPEDVMFWLNRVGTEVEVKLAHQPGWTRATVLDAFTVTTETHFYGRKFRPLETAVQLVSTTAVRRKPCIFRRPSELRLVFENELTSLPTVS